MGRLAEDAVIITLTATEAVVDIHRAQGINSLRATRLQVCLLFNPRLEIKRIVLVDKI